MASFLIAALTSSSPGGFPTRQDAPLKQEIPQRSGVLHQFSVSGSLLNSLFTHKPGRCSSFSSVPVIKLPDRKLLREERVYLALDSRSQPMIVGKSRWELKLSPTGKSRKRMQAWTSVGQFVFSCFFPSLYGSNLCLGNGTTHNGLSLISIIKTEFPTDIPTRQSDLCKFLIQTFFSLRKVSAEAKAKTKEDWVLAAHSPAKARMPRGGASYSGCFPLSPQSHTHSQRLIWSDHFHQVSSSQATLGYAVLTTKTSQHPHTSQIPPVMMPLPQGMPPDVDVCSWASKAISSIDLFPLQESNFIYFSIAGFDTNIYTK